MLPLKCTNSTISQTLGFLQEAGRSRQECVVLWLGRRHETHIEICEVLHPLQNAHADMFHLPPASMNKIMEYLRQNRIMIAAQVHSHPKQAFHSPADDMWAIIRHVGAVSIVLPDFALHTTLSTFFHDAAFFNLSPENRWIKAPDNVLGIE